MATRIMCDQCKNYNNAGKNINSLQFGTFGFNKEHLKQFFVLYDDSALIKANNMQDYHVCIGCLKKFVNGKIDKWGKKIKFVDVKCSDCSYEFNTEMRWLVWKVNCPKCKQAVSEEDRIKKTKFKISDYR